MSETYEFHERVAIVADGCNVPDEEAERMALRHEFEQRQRQLIREREAKLK